MSEESKLFGPESRLFVLALGVLIGFVIGFVFLLSRLPVDETINGFTESLVEPVPLGESGFEYYSVLPRQTPVRSPAPARQPIPRPLDLQQAAVNTQVIVPAAAVPGRQKVVDMPAKAPAQASYFLQAGTFQLADQAERVRIDLLRLGLEAFIVVRQDDRGSVTHRVRVGPFIDQVGLDSARNRLRSGGVRFQVVRVTG
ncbi:MAG: SPOR domain-containing protein [Granulosicoccus sp.]